MNFKVGYLLSHAAEKSRHNYHKGAQCIHSFHNFFIEDDCKPSAFEGLGIEELTKQTTISDVMQFTINK